MGSLGSRIAAGLVLAIALGGAAIWHFGWRLPGIDSGPRQRFVSIGTGGPTGVYFIVGQSVCRMVHKGSQEGRPDQRSNGLRCSAPSTGGSVYNLQNIQSGELDFGVVQSDTQYDAYRGKGSFQGKPFNGLRAVFSVHAEPFQIVVARDAGISSWDDLRGKRVNLGNPGSGQRATMEMLMKAHGMAMADFASTAEFTSTEQSSALCEGRIDAYVYSVGVPNAGEALAADGCDARIISLNGPIEKALVSENPYFSFALIPKGTYRTTVADIVTFGVRATFVTRADVREDTVYEVARAVFDNIGEFRRLHPSFETLDSQEMTERSLTAPLHPGALRYYKERGWR